MIAFCLITSVNIAPIVELLPPYCNVITDYMLPMVSSAYAFTLNLSFIFGVDGEHNSLWFCLFRLEIVFLWLRYFHFFFRF